MRLSGKQLSQHLHTFEKLASANGTVTYGTVFSPSLDDVLDVQLRLQFLRHAFPIPPVGMLSFSVLVFEQVPIDILVLVAVAMTPSFDLIDASRSSHSNMDYGIIPLSIILLLPLLLLLIPESRHKFSHDLVVDTDRLGMNEDANLGEGDGGRG